jgi:MFS family permease
VSLRQKLGLPSWRGRRPLLVAILVDSLGSGLFLPFSIVFFLRTTSMGLPAIGTALSLAELVTMPGLPIYGQLLDRLGPRALVTIGNLVSAVGFVGFLWVHSPLDLVLAAALVDCGSGLFWTANPALIGAAADSGERPLWFGLTRVLRNGGIGIGALAAGALVAADGSQGLRLVVVANAGSFIAAATLVSWWPWSQPSSARPPARLSAGAGRAGYLTVLGDGRFRRLVAANVIFVLCGDALTLLLAVYLSRDLHAPLAIAGGLFTVNTALVVLLQTTTTRVCEGVAKPAVLRWAAAIWAVSFLLLGGMMAVPRPLIVPGLLVAIAVFTLAEMLESPAMSDLVVSCAAGPSMGRYLAVHQVSWAVGAATAPVLFTWLLNRGPLWPWLALAGACLGAILMLRAGDWRDGATARPDGLLPDRLSG